MFFLISKREHEKRQYAFYFLFFLEWVTICWVIILFESVSMIPHIMVSIVLVHVINELHLVLIVKLNFTCYYLKFSHIDLVYEYCTRNFDRFAINLIFFIIGWLFSLLVYFSVHWKFDVELVENILLVHNIKINNIWQRLFEQPLRLLILRFYTHHSAGLSQITSFSWFKQNSLMKKKKIFFQEMNDKQSSNKIVQINHIVVSMYQWHWSLSSNNIAIL